MPVSRAATEATIVLLEALGLLKYEEPETPADVLGDIVLHRGVLREIKWPIGADGAKHILFCLEHAGFEIVPKG
jgi:hypothetical protein